MSDALLITGGCLIDATGSRTADLGIVDGLIVDPGEVPAKTRRIDADGAIVSTGLVDLHVHMGEPGDEAAETIATAAAAAVAGGYTTILAMPITDPVVDTAAVVDHVRMLASNAPCRVEVAGAVTVGGHGECLAPLGELAAAGVRMITDCGAGVQDPLIMRRALEYSRPLGLTIAQAAECRALSRGAHMNEGEWSSRLGLAGTPAEAEEIQVKRDLALARLTGGRIHFQTLSTARAFDAVAAAVAEGSDVTAEVAAHHLLLCDADLAGYDPNRKVTPPLRSAADREAARRAVQGGQAVIVSDHTPHPTDRKDRPFDHAEPGSIGLDFALAMALTAGIDPADALVAMSERPAAILGQSQRQAGARALVPGAVADITIIDPSEVWTARAADSPSIGTNCAVEGLELTGRAITTIVDGHVVYDSKEVLV